MRPSLTGVLKELWSDRLFRWLAALPIAAMIAGALVGAYNDTYSATAHLLPEEGEQMPAGVAGLAAQFGLPMTQGSGRSPEFYAELLNMRSLRDEVIKSGICRTPGGGATCERASLWTVLEVDSTGSRESLSDLHREFDRHASARAQVRVGLVEVQTRAEEPWIAESLNQALLNELQAFDQDKRRLRAVAEREFLEGRVMEYERSVEQLEDTLRMFLEGNRVINAPALQFENDRYERKLSQMNQVLSTVTESLERARIEEVRTTPVFTVVASPLGAAEREGGAVRTAALGLSLGIALALAGFLMLRTLPAHIQSLLESSDGSAG